jgi:hypothetical protein
VVSEESPATEQGNAINRDRGFLLCSDSSPSSAWFLTAIHNEATAARDLAIARQHVPIGLARGLVVGAGKRDIPEALDAGRLISPRANV